MKIKLRPTAELSKYYRSTDDLMPCPEPGAGVNDWLFTTACALCRRKFTETEVLRYLAEHAARVETREITRAVQRACDQVNQTPSHEGTQSGDIAPPRPPKWPEENTDLIKAFDRTGFGLADLWEISTAKPAPDTPPHVFLDLAFAMDELICAAQCKRSALTKTLREWGDEIDQMQFIVPNAASQAKGLTQEGKESFRAKSMFPHRRFIVVEFDSGTLDSQAARLRYLASKAPLGMVVFSGGKSLHGWFPCAGVSDERLREFFGEGLRLGCDKSMWEAHQLARMPHGIRQDNGKLQRVCYLAPDIMKNARAGDPSAPNSTFENYRHGQSNKS